jgi:hypothetical protein
MRRRSSVSVQNLGWPGSIRYRARAFFTKDPSVPYALGTLVSWGATVVPKRRG